MNELEKILQFYEDVAPSRSRLALATVIKTQGSSYRSPGARSLICEDGTYCGGLSAGCLEADIACRLDGGTQPFVVSYDLSSADDVRGFPFGCGGNVEIYVEPIESTAQLDLLRWLSSAEEELVVVTPIGHKPAGCSQFATTLSRRCFGMPSNCDCLDTHIRVAFEDKKSRLVLDAAGRRWFIEYFEPYIALTIFGDGEDALALAEFAAAVGINVRRITRGQLRSDEAEKLTRNAFNVVMTHDLNLDATALDLTLSASPRYVGIMGPASRTERLLELLSEESRRRAKLVDLYAPVGLDMRAETPREIALSIMAEIQTVARSRKPAHLRDVKGPIHDRQPLYFVVGTVLAAGGSSRFGSSKQLVRFAGETLIEHAQRVLLGSSVDQASIILGCNAGTISAFVAPSVTTIMNPGWQEGISSSIRAAVEFAKRRNASHLLITLCDQPLVTPQLIQQLLDLSRQHPDSIVACDYGESLGVPAVFPRAFFDQLLELRGDRGAKSIIGQVTAKRTIPFPDGIVDIDTPEDARGAVEIAGVRAHLADR